MSSPRPSDEADLSGGGREGVPMRRNVVVLAFVLFAGGCGSDSSSPPRDTEEPATSGTEAAPALVGTWERETSCQEVVSVLKRAGLGNWLVETIAGNGFIPGVTDPDEIADPANPCKGAVPRVHSHFFTPDGEFGSLDWNGQEVDFGTYEIVNDHTFVISKEFPEPIAFNYTIQSDTLMFEPVMIPECTPECFEALWSVIVAYPGKEWHRVDD